jgi:hypothetical protein
MKYSRWLPIHQLSMLQGKSGAAYLTCEVNVLEQNDQQRQSVFARGGHHIRLKGGSQPQ